MEVFQYNGLQNLDGAENINIIKKFNNILEKNNVNNGLKEKLKVINEKNFNKDDLDTVISNIKWNTYYYKKYRQQTKLLVFIIFISILMICLTKMRSSYFDDKSYSFIMGILLACAFIYIFYSLWDILIKDTKNFDEYDFSIYGTGHYNPNIIHDKSNIDISNVDLSNCMIKNLTKNDVNGSFLNKYF